MSLHFKFGGGLPGMEESAGLPQNTNPLPAFANTGSVVKNVLGKNKGKGKGVLSRTADVYKQNVAEQLVKTAPPPVQTAPPPLEIASTIPLVDPTKGAPMGVNPAPATPGAGLSQGGGAGGTDGPSVENFVETAKNNPIFQQGAGLRGAGTPIPLGIDMGAPGGMPVSGGVGGVGGVGGRGPNPGRGGLGNAPVPGWLSDRERGGTTDDPSGSSSSGYGLDDMLSNSDDIYAQDQNVVKREANRLRRQAASMNALSGATGSGGFHMAGQNAATASELFAGQQAAAEHAQRQIDIQLSVLEKQLAAAEKQKDRNLEAEIANQIDAFKRHKLDIDSALTGEGDGDGSAEESLGTGKVHSEQLEDKGGLTNGQTLDGMKYDLQQQLDANPNMTQSQFMAWLDVQFPAGPPHTDTDVLNARQTLWDIWSHATR